MADGLFEHMTILRDERPGHPALRRPPAWADYDWGSLLAHSEPVLAGLAAGAYTDGSTTGVASYNARCVLDLLSRGMIAAAPGTSLAVVSAHQSGFLALAT